MSYEYFDPGELEGLGYDAVWEAEVLSILNDPVIGITGTQGFLGLPDENNIDVVFTSDLTKPSTPVPFTLVGYTAAAEKLAPWAIPGLGQAGLDPGGWIRNKLRDLFGAQLGEIIYALMDKIPGPLGWLMEMLQAIDYLSIHQVAVYIGKDFLPVGLMEEDSFYSWLRTLKRNVKEVIRSYPAGSTFGDPEETDVIDEDREDEAWYNSLRNLG